MKIVEFLERLEELKAQYTLLADRYFEIEYDGVPVHLGSGMFLDSLLNDYPENIEKYLKENNTTLEELQLDHEKAGKIIEHANEMVLKLGLNNVISEGNILMFLKVIPHEETSMY